MSEKAEKKTAILDFFKGVKSEFKRITWPDKVSLLKQSAVVISVSLVVGVIIALMDSVIQFVVNIVLSL